MSGKTEFISYQFGPKHAKVPLYIHDQCITIFKKAFDIKKRIKHP